jgi:hypothetical protein
MKTLVQLRWSNTKGALKMIVITLNQKLPGYRGTVGDATMAAHEGCKRAARALKAQGMSLVPGGILMELEISPLGEPELPACDDLMASIMAYPCRGYRGTYGDAVFAMVNGSTHARRALRRAGMHITPNGPRFLLAPETPGVRTFARDWA